MKRSINTVVFSTLPVTTPIGPWVKGGAPLPEGTEAGGSLALCCRHQWPNGSQSRLAHSDYREKGRWLIMLRSPGMSGPKAANGTNHDSTKWGCWMWANKQLQEHWAHPKHRILNYSVPTERRQGVFEFLPLYNFSFSIFLLLIIQLPLVLFLI